MAVRDGRIVAITAPGGLAGWRADAIFEAEGRVLAPGFIDVHTHDDTHVIRSPQMLPKLTQGVTTVIVGNCGISASPVTLKGDPPDPMNLLGDAARVPISDLRRLRRCGERRAAGGERRRADRPHGAAQQPHGPARPGRDAAEIEAMRAQLEEALDNGALGLSSGLAYGSAFSAPPEEVKALAEPLSKAGALYTTHMRTEFDAILDAMDEAYRSAAMRACRW